MPTRMTQDDRVGLARPALDAHTLGLTSLAGLLGECGCDCVLAEPAVCAGLNTPDAPSSLDALARWIADKRITVLGLSYRLDPQDGLRLVEHLVDGLKARRLLDTCGGPIRAFYFAGLPRTCDLVRRQVPEVAGTFEGDETAAETLERLGVAANAVPRSLAAGLRYDEDLLAFGRDLIRGGDHLGVEPVSRSGYREFGTARDTLAARLRHGRERGLPPLMRAHAGPFLPDRPAAVRLFLDWTRQLAASGLLDVLSIGTSQLTQSNFGEDWAGRPNGGGVPLNSPDEYAAVWHAARPMLVRTYAGTRDPAALARMYEQRIHIAWHALSLWWFCRIDGRGPYAVRENLERQLDAVRYAAATRKPYEPNVAHHFAFRGADDVTCIAAAALAARTARALGVGELVLQVMLNTPRATWGIQDLAKARAALRLARELEGPGFRVILQPRGGLDFFSPSPQKAKAQLAAVTALMDDIEPDDPHSPPLLHVVSYSEGYELADPAVIVESIRIVRHALDRYRRMKAKGDAEDRSRDAEVAARTDELVSEARVLLRAIEASGPRPYAAEGLYRAFAGGYLAAPYLWECRDEFARATRWQTRLISGGVKVVDEVGTPITAAERVRRIGAVAADG